MFGVRFKFDDSAAACRRACSATASERLIGVNRFRNVKPCFFGFCDLGLKTWKFMFLFAFEYFSLSSEVYQWVPGRNLEQM